MTTSKEELYQKEIEKYFNQTAEEKGKETKFIERKRKVSASLFLQALIWTVYREGKISLGQLAATMQALELECDVSEQALDERFNKEAKEFLQTMFVEALKQSLPEQEKQTNILSTFKAVYLIDSSTVSLPDILKEEFTGCGGDGAESSVKMYLLLNYLTGRYQAIELRDGKKADQNMGEQFLREKPTQALWIFDLGFFKLDFLQAIVELGSYFLSRLQSQVVISVINSNAKREVFDLDTFLKYAPKDRVFELEIYLSNRKFSTRLICSAVNTEVAATRRRKAKEKAQTKGRTPSQKYLARCDWSLYITNAPAEQLPTSTIATVYRVRWQIELVFKLAKSQANLDHISSKKPHRVMCEFYAKLIALLLFERLVEIIPCNSKLSISPVKAWRRLSLLLLVWGRQIRQSCSLVCLLEIISFLSHRSKSSSKLKHPSTLQRLDLAANDAFICCWLNPLTFLQLVLLFSSNNSSQFKLVA